MLGDAGRNLQFEIEDGVMLQIELRRLVHEVQADACLIGGLATIGRVVHLAVERRTGRHQHAGPLRIGIGLVARHEGHQLRLEQRPATVDARHVLRLGIAEGGDRVMQYLAITRHDLHGTHPHVAIQRVGCLKELVIDGACGGRRERRQVHDQIRLSQFPLSRGLNGHCQWIIAGAALRARIDPMHQGLRLGNAQAHVVIERVDLRIGMPGRHTLGENHLANHRREALHHRVTGHGPRADAASTVTIRTFFLQQRRNVRAVGNIRVLRNIAAGKIERFATVVCGRWCAGQCWRLTVCKSGQGCLQVILAAAIGAFGHRTTIGDLPTARIDDQHLSRIGQSQCLADELGAILQDGGTDALAFLVLLQAGACGIRLRIDQEERH